MGFRKGSKNLKYGLNVMHRMKEGKSEELEYLEEEKEGRMNMRDGLNSKRRGKLAKIEEREGESSFFYFIPHELLCLISGLMHLLLY